MDSQKFCLKWDGFQSSVTSVFDSLRQVEELVDVTLCCEGQRLRAHRMMLSACSPYFRELFKGLQSQQLVIFLKDTSAADLIAIVEFIYKGSVNVSQSQLGSFIKTAELLQIRGLSGDEDKSTPAFRHPAASSRLPAASSRPAEPTPRHAASSYQQSAPASPAPRLPPESPLPPPPPPPAASPPPKRRRASEPPPSPVAVSPTSPARAGCSTPGESPRPSSLPSVGTREPPGQQGERTAQEEPKREQGQHHGHLGQSQDLPHGNQGHNQDRLQGQHHDQHQGHQGQHEQNQGQHSLAHRHQQNQQQYHHPSGQENQSASSAPSLADGTVKVEKFDLTEDEVSLGDTLDHVAELERLGDAEDGGEGHLQQQQQLQQRGFNFAEAAAAAAAAAAHRMAAVAGPSQHPTDDGTAHGNTGVTSMPTDSPGDSGGEGVSCAVCGRRYSHPHALLHHAKVHEGRTTCPLCGKVLGRMGHLRTHMTLVHKLTGEEVRKLVPTRQYYQQPEWNRGYRQQAEWGQQAEWQPGQAEWQAGQAEWQAVQAEWPEGQTK